MNRLAMTFTMMLIVVGTMGQMVKYPYQNMIKKGDFQTAKKELTKELKKMPGATGLNYTMYKLYTTKTYEGYNLEQAYEYLLKSYKGFQSMNGEEKAMAMKNGFSDNLYKVNLEYLCQEIFESRVAGEKNLEKYKDFIARYEYMSKELELKVKAEIDRLVMNGIGEENGFLSKCRLLREEPNAEWAVKAKEELWNEVKKGDDIELLECAVDVFDGERQEKIFGLMHGIWVSRDLSVVDSMYRKYEKYNSPTLKMHRERDDAMGKAMKDAGGKVTARLIDMVAPYNIGVSMLAVYADSLKRAGKSVKEIQKVMDDFKLSYGGNIWYRNMMKAMWQSGEKINAVSIEGVNTSGDEYSPFVTADDKWLYFVGRNRKDNLGKEDIYRAGRVGTSWGNAELVKGLNTKDGNEAVQAVTMDGEKMVLFKDGKLYEVTRKSKGWGSPQKMPESVNISKWQADASYISDGKAILFAARTRTGREMQTSENIYITIKDSTGHWCKPIDLGEKINTAFNERAPFLHPDMRTLYFSSDGHGAIGSYDVWVTKRVREDSWTEWTEPQNLGCGINSAGLDCWYKISTDGELAYFSKSGENGGENIFSVKIPKEMRPEPVAILRGHLKDMKGNSVDAIIRWEDLETGELIGSVHTNGVDGSYFMAIPLGRNYGYYVEKEGYYPLASSVDLRNEDKNVVVDREIVLVSFEEMKKEGIDVPINNLFFATGKSDLLSESRLELNRIAYILKNLKSVVEISGHTDNVGEPEKNRELSENRSRAVRDYLIQKGCEWQWISIIGYGADRPKVSNETEEGRALNRRVELRIR